MVAIVGMGVIMDPAGPVIPEMGRNNKDDGEDHHPDMMLGEPLFQAKKEKADTKQQQGGKAMVMAAVPMPQGVHTND